jgi:hypothetical protein
MQLDACLRSLEAFAPYGGRVLVIYRATTPAFADAYQSIELSTRTELVEESNDFRQDVLTAVRSDATGYVVFHTDDDIFFRRPPSIPQISEDFASFSLRLGRNTTYSYPYGTTQRLPRFAEHGPVLAWDWTRAELDFGYPMSLDGHIFRTDLLLRLLGNTPVANPNELEDELQWRRYLAPRWMLSSRESSLVSIPLNSVTSACVNRTAGDPAFSAEALNTRFLDGERIDLDRLDVSSISAAHQEIPIAFARGSSA